MPSSRSTASLLAVLSAVSVGLLLAASDASAQELRRNNNVFRIQAPKSSQALNRRVLPPSIAPKAQQAPKVQFAAPPKVEQAPKLKFAAPPKVERAPQIQFAAPPKVQQAPRNPEVAQFVAPKAPKAKKQKFVAPKAPQELETAQIVAPKAEGKKAKVASLAPVETPEVAQQEPVEQPAPEAAEKPAEQPAEKVTERPAEDQLLVVEYRGLHYNVRKGADGTITVLGYAEGYGDEPAYTYEYAQNTYAGYGYGGRQCASGY